MKSFKSTWIFLTLVIVVVGLAFYQYKKDQKDEKSSTEKAMLINEADRDIVEVKITSNNSVLELKRDQDQWKIVKPIEDLADESAASSFASSFANQKVQETEKSGPAVDWKQYGFDSDKTKQIDLKSVTGKDYHLTVSGKNAFDGRYYIRMNDKLLLGEIAWASILAREQSTLRDKRLLRDSAEPSEVVIQSKGNKLKLTRVDGKWTGPANLKLDREKIDYYIGEILEAVADGVVDKRSGSSKQAEIVVVQKDKPTKLIFYSRKSAATQNPNAPQNIFDYFVEVEGRPVIYRLNKSEHEKLVTDENALRDKKWPFAFPLEQVAEVSVKMTGVDFKIKKSGDDWLLENPTPEQELDKNRLPTFFEKIKNMEAEEFIPSRFAKGFNPPRGKIIMKDSSGVEVFSFEFGDEFSKGKDTVPMLYTKSNLTKEIMAVKTGAVSAIPMPVVNKTKTVEGEKK